MTGSSVDRIYSDFKAISAWLETAGEVSLRASINDLYGKALLVAAASWFEYFICEAIFRVTDELSSRSEIITSFIRNKAIKRQFHTYFDWKTTSASQFFGLFGEGFRDYMETQVNSSQPLADAIKAFMNLGAERNRMLHGDYGSYNLMMTTDEVFDRYQRALPFVEGLENHLKSFNETRKLKDQT